MPRGPVLGVISERVLVCMHGLNYDQLYVHFPRSSLSKTSLPLENQQVKKWAPVAN